jgi:hypothetical protein
MIGLLSWNSPVCLGTTGVYQLDLALALHRSPRVEVAAVNPAAVRAPPNPSGS